MILTPHQQGQALVIAVNTSRLDAANAVRFKDEMRQLSEDGKGDVVLDLSSVQFLDSSGLGALVAAMKLLGPKRRLEIAGLTPNVDKVIRLTRMDTIFRIHSCAAAPQEVSHAS